MGTRTKNRWFVEVSRSRLKECALYAIPHAGGGVATVRSLCVELGDAFDTFGVRLPGRESRLGDPVVTIMSRLADELAGELLRHAQGRPVVLYGHCSGSAIAYEVARRMDPAQLRGLAVSSHPAPGSVRRAPTWELPRQEFLKQVVTDGYLPPEIIANEELLDIYEPAVRADYELVETYELDLFGGGPVEAVAAPTVAIYGRDDHTIDPVHIDAWSTLTIGPFRVVSLAGGHNLLLGRPAELAAAICQGLASDDRLHDHR
ncbi:thioesterase [Verrucosispora sp. CWR15]|uniref:Thioesterase n=1 Tax=Verrucosispora sioxanthis TaxID=2499994 RepID=A0A6M1KY07_9ACTN|nr:alpha/beta fold hydrolase [Verrucosispora sioxanthis]NEE65025.1 thioesterase [Verrucosispora sioxanthis]NGM14135.1 thioesterase [Verrucosispora sioxanthis]